MDEEKKGEENNEQPEFGKVAVGFIVAVLVLGGIVYAGYQYSQKKGKEKVLPAGYPAQGGQPVEIDCSKPRDPAANIWAYYLKCDRIKGDEKADWVKHKNEDYGFNIMIPSGLNIEIYSNGLGVPYKDIPGTSHLLYSIDLAASRSGEFKKMTGKQYVENYWRQFSGIAGVNYVEGIVNEQGVKGWKANYKFASGQDSPNTEIFFEITADSGDFIHFASGIFEPSVFDKIVGSFKIEGSETGKEE